MDYAPILLKNIVDPLIEDENDGIEESLSVIKEYCLLREDIDSLVELSTWPGKKSPMELVNGRVKAALTRAYNKEVAPYSYSTITATKKKRQAASDDYENELEEGNGGSISDDNEEDDSIENDALIKKAKKEPAKASAKNKPSTSGTSKKKATSSKKK